MSDRDLEHEKFLKSFYAAMVKSGADVKSVTDSYKMMAISSSSENVKKLAEVLPKVTLENLSFAPVGNVLKEPSDENINAFNKFTKRLGKQVGKIAASLLKSMNPSQAARNINNQNLKELRFKNLEGLGASVESGVESSNVTPRQQKPGQGQQKS